jgi:hypothetical protein
MDSTTKPTQLYTRKRYIVVQGTKIENGKWERGISIKENENIT